MLEMAQAGCVAFSNDGLPVPGAEFMRRAMEYAADAGRIVIDHCEEPSMNVGAGMNEGAVSGRLGLPAQPDVAESMQVARDILLADYLKIPVHLAHGVRFLALGGGGPLAGFAAVELGLNVGLGEVQTSRAAVYDAAKAHAMRFAKCCEAQSLSECIASHVYLAFIQHLKTHTSACGSALHCVYASVAGVCLRSRQGNFTLKLLHDRARAARSSDAV